MGRGEVRLAQRRNTWTEQQSLDGVNEDRSGFLVGAGYLLPVPVRVRRSEVDGVCWWCSDVVVRRPAVGTASPPVPVRARFPPMSAGGGNRLPTCQA